MECVLYRHLYINNIILFWPILTFTQIIKYQIVWSNSFQKFHLLNRPWFQILERWYNYYHNNSHRRCHKVNRFCDKLHMEFLLKDCSYILLHSTVLLGLGLRSYLWAQTSITVFPPPVCWWEISWSSFFYLRIWQCTRKLWNSPADSVRGTFSGFLWFFDW